MQQNDRPKFRTLTQLTFFNIFVFRYFFHLNENFDIKQKTLIDSFSAVYVQF